VADVLASDLERLSGWGASPGHRALAVPAYEYAHPEDLISPGPVRPLIVALDGVTDPRNLGSIVRFGSSFSAPTGSWCPKRRAAGSERVSVEGRAPAPLARLRVARATKPWLARLALTTRRA